MKKDKIKHAIAGLILYAIGYALIALIFNTDEAFAYGLIFPFVGRIGKEVYDSFQDNHTADYLDFFATVITPVAIAIVISLFKLIVNT